MSSPLSNPTSTRSTPAPRARGGPRAGVTRKTKAEREKYAAEQAEREKKRIATPSTPSQTPARGRGAGRGARGGLQRESSHATSDGTGFGVFGSAVGVSRGRDSKKGHSGQEEWLAGSAAKKEDLQKAGTTSGEGSASKTTVIPAPGGPADSSVPQKVVVEAIAIASDDEGDAARRDIERIWISSEEEDASAEEDDVMTSKGKQRATDSITKPRRTKKNGGIGGLRPVRAPRVHLNNEHGDEEGGTTVKALSKRNKRESTTGPVIIDDSGDAMDVDGQGPTLQPLPRESTSSPELKKKSLAKRTTPRSRDARLHALETAEERAERLRVAEDSTKLLNIFNPTNTSAQHAPLTTTTSHDSSSSAKGKGKALPTPLQEGRLYLMQFPPLTPLLVDPELEAQRAAAAAEEAASTIPDPTNPSLGGIPIKSDPDAPKPATTSAQQSGAPQHPGLITAPHLTNTEAQARTRLPRGKVGKLRIHASGKVTLDWGGVDMEVRLGTEVDFLQDAVLVDSGGVLGQERAEGGDDGLWGDRAGDGAGGGGEVVENNGEGEGEEDGGQGHELGGVARDKGKGKAKAKAGEEEGKVYALGQVVGKLVVVPDWGKLYD